MLVGKMNKDRAELVSTVTISEKGQVTIPKQVRESLELKAGDKVGFYGSEAGYVVRKAGTDEGKAFKLAKRLLKHEKTVQVTSNNELDRVELIVKVLNEMHTDAKVTYFSKEDRVRKLGLEGGFGFLLKDSVTFVSGENTEEEIEKAFEDASVLVVDSNYLLNECEQSVLNLVDGLVHDSNKTLIIDSRHSEWTIRSEFLELNLISFARDEAGYDSVLNIHLWDSDGVDYNRETLYSSRG